MAGRTRKPGSAAGVVPAAAPANDLTASHGLGSLSGQRVVDIGRKTLDASERLIGAWDELEPIVRILIGKVKAFAERPEVETVLAAKLLSEIATVASRIGTAATSVMRASEGQIRLAVLIEGPRPEKRHPSEMTERQLVNVVLETAKRIMREQGGVCPVCGPAVITVSENGKGEECS